MTYPTTGYTPTISERARLRNEIKACIQSRRAVLLDPASFEYWTNRLCSAITKYREYLQAEKDARIRALFYELETCDKMQRILEIQEALKEYGVEIVDQREMELMDLYADGRRMHRAGAL